MSKIIFAIGLFTTAVVTVKALKLISIYLLPSRLSRYIHLSPNGESPWAIVTGASDGIGRAFAQELASQGFNVVLHGRNHAKLSVVLSQLQKTYPERSFRILIADASAVPCSSCLRSEQQQTGKSQPGDTLDYSAIKAALEDLHLTVLINNAGGGPVNPVFAPLSESSAARVTDNVSVNALFPLHLTRLLLPNLTRNAPSLIMNISSMADQGFPLLASYGASKQFLMSVTNIVDLEMAFQGKAGDVELLGIRVGKATGVSHSKESSSLFTPDAKTVARAALDRAGHGHGIITGYWAHALQELGVRLLPKWLRDKVVIIAMKQERDNELKAELKRA